MIRCSPAARSAGACGREQDAVGGERQIGDRTPGREAFDQHRQVAPQQRLAAGDAHAIDAERVNASTIAPISSNVRMFSRGSHT